MVLDFLELVIVCGYVGYLWIEEMVVVVCKYENVYIDILVYIIKWLFGKLVWFMKIDMG